MQLTYKNQHYSWIKTKPIRKYKGRESPIYKINFKIGYKWLISGLWQ